MRQAVSVFVLAAVIVLAAAPAVSAGPALRGFLPPNARPHGQSLVDLATAWNHWALGTAEDVNPLLDVRCEPSPEDPRIWFLPVSLGGEWETTCEVPTGTFLVLNAGGWECSSLEEEPFFGSNEEELRACVEAGFEFLSYVEVTLDGRTTTDLDAYAVTSRLDTLPADNLFGQDPGLTMSKDYLLVLQPLSRGTHALRAYDEFAEFDFQAGINYTILVR